jgi:hypothetical protein
MRTERNVPLLARVIRVVGHACSVTLGCRPCLQRDRVVGHACSVTLGCRPCLQRDRIVGHACSVTLGCRHA